jgi:putative transposase
MERGFLYLVAIMDWHSRKVFDGLTRPHRGHGPISPWRLSNTLEADFCVAALKEALAEYGPPEVFNTDQGAQFTSATGLMSSRRSRCRYRWMARDAGSTTA